MTPATLRFTISLAALLILLVEATPLAASNEPPTTRHVALTRVVANVEEAAMELTPVARGMKPLPGGKQPVTPLSGEIWYGRVFRRLPGDGPEESSHMVPFAVEYRNGLAHRAVVDRDFDGSLDDDSVLSLNQYPAIPGARSCLVELSWNAGAHWSNPRVRWTVRLVFEPKQEGHLGPACRIQKVYGMVGEIAIDGASRSVLLVDGDGNGRYARDDFGDGLYIDQDGDRHFLIEPFAGSFVPLAVPTRVGGHIYEVRSVREDGSEVVVSDTPASGPPDTLVVGSHAPDFNVVDRRGRAISLKTYRGKTLALCFVASWCGGCSRQLPEYAALYDRYRSRGFEVLAVSYDRVADEGEAFVRRFNPSWAVYAPGKLLWENPLGQKYRVDHPGLSFLIDSESRLLGSFEEPSDLESALSKHFASASR